MEESIISVRMKLFGKSYIIVALAVFPAASCSREDVRQDGKSLAKVEMALDTQPATRAHFEDRDGTATFVWDADGSMIAAVSKGGSIVQWNGGEWYSPMHISLIAPDDSRKALRATSGLTLLTDAAAAGDPLFFLSPVNGSSLCSIEASDQAVSVTFYMPSVFEQSASGRLEEFGDYCFIRGESTVKSTPSASDKNFAAASTTFRAIPATFRFNVRNTTDSDVILESVKITCDRLFPDKLCWKTDGSAVTVTEPEDKSGYFNTIKTSIDAGYGELVGKKDGETVHTGTYYAVCLPFDSESSLDGATLAFILETSDKIHTFNIAAADFFRESACKKFESNRIYTFNFALNDNSVELEGVSISDWVGDPFNVPTEEVSLFLKVSPSYWVQDRKNVYTYGFMKMYGNTLWAECNLGEYLYSSFDVTLNWYEVTPADASDEDYLATYFDNIKDFKWKTPSRADFIQLFSLPEDNIEMCRDGESGVYGLRIKSTVSTGASIFLPSTLTTKTEYTESGTTTIHRLFDGYYWTRDEDETDPDKAYLLHFAFEQTETVEGETSSFSQYGKVLDGGNALYEFVTKEKYKNHTVRAILQND